MSDTPKEVGHVVTLLDVTALPPFPGVPAHAYRCSCGAEFIGFFVDAPICPEGMNDVKR